jgi:hypothetical protein
MKYSNLIEDYFFEMVDIETSIKQHFFLKLKSITIKPKTSYILLKSFTKYQTEYSG